MALWDLPELGEDMGVFWWFHHQNTPIYPLYHGDSQRLFIISTEEMKSKNFLAVDIKTYFSLLSVGVNHYIGYYYHITMIYILLIVLSVLYFGF